MPNHSMHSALSRGFKPFRRAAVACLLIAPCVAQAWWSPDWAARKELSLNTTASGANIAAAVNEPTVLLRLHQGNFPQFLNVRDGGADFRVVAGDDRTPLAYHLERFDPIAEIALLWVKLPVVNTQSQAEKFFLYFANASAVKGEEPGASFDPATVAAFHFGESQGLPIDSTAYATPVADGEVVPNPASIIGGGVSLPGTKALTLTDNGALAHDPVKGWSAGLWLRLPELPAEDAYLIDRLANGQRLSMLVSGGHLLARLDATEVRAPMPLNAATWTHAAVVVGASELQLFVNGALAGSAAVTPQAMSGAVQVGGAADGSGLLTADIDELRISNAARSADWLQLEAGIGGERNDAIVTYGADQTGAASDAEGGEEKTSYFAVIFQNVFGNEEAIVEQVVIGVCVLMALLAFLVMFMKALYLSRARAASNRFLKAYQSLQIGGTGELALEALVDKERRYGVSPLFQVYRQALNEVRRRRGAAVGAAPAGLDDKAVGSIRAAMDAVMVRQQQKMNALMVLLTIAISGGPFIGLFGTVVGVMVTFAAIAATGDVNINAIAPGMAAALLATVAGLGVAIPSLFGYNYLGSKVKELAADMHVYADELTARVVEEFGH